MSTDVRMRVIVVFLLFSVVGAYYLGARSTVMYLTGSAHSAEGAITIEADGWSYGVPMDGSWTDSQGSLHDRGRPECLPPSTSLIKDVHFAAMNVSAAGIGWRPVVWVGCNGAETP
jgi:hypothetical protein